MQNINFKTKDLTKEILSFMEKGGDRGGRKKGQSEKQSGATECHFDLSQCLFSYAALTSKFFQICLTPR